MSLGNTEEKVKIKLIMQKSFLFYQIPQVKCPSVCIKQNTNINCLTESNKMQSIVLSNRLYLFAINT